MKDRIVDFPPYDHHPNPYQPNDVVVFVRTAKPAVVKHIDGERCYIVYLEDQPVSSGVWIDAENLRRATPVELAKWKCENESWKAYAESYRTRKV